MNQNIFLISDTHFYHKNIFEYEPDRKKFKDIENYVNEITQNWNSVVTNNDIVLHLGDVFCGTYEYCKNNKLNEFELMKKTINDLNGEKILIKGNHDRKSNDFYLSIGFDAVYDFLIIDNILFTHYPIDKNYLDNYFSVRKIKNKETFYNLLNIPFVKNIHGHLHSKSTNDKKFINVSVEKINYTPINLNEVLKENK